MKFWFKFFKDKRFSWDFKIANFIMKDYLRNYLSIDCIVLKEIIEDRNADDFSKRKANKILTDLYILMHSIKE